MDILKHFLQELNEIDQEIIRKASPIVILDSSSYRGCNTACDLEVIINGQPAVITVGFPHSFPKELPKFFDEEDRFGFIPHKEPDGFICFTKNESLIIDERYPASIVVNCLEKVIEVLQLGTLSLNTSEFSDEFEAYWSHQTEILSIYGHVNPTNEQVRYLDLVTFSQKNSPLTIAFERGPSVERSIQSIFKVELKEGYSHRCLYFPLKKGAIIYPPNYGSTWDYQTLKTIIFDHLSTANKHVFKTLVKRREIFENKNTEYIIVGVPINENKYAFWGFRFRSEHKYVKQNIRNKNRKLYFFHPLIYKPKNLKMTPISIERWHPNHLLNRTGGDSSLLNKKIVIVGTGSVGSEIAVRLAKAGISNITLIDPDKMELNNIHRHALGSDQVLQLQSNSLVNQYKVEGLKNEIQRMYPFTNVEVYRDNFIDLWNKKCVSWKDIDLMIVAIGAPNKEMEINQIMKSTPLHPSVVYTWVEPLGIGGHALATLNNNKNGCYQCLFEQYGDEPMSNKAAFAQPFQSFSKTITGCGSTFIPYSFLDSERTALTALELGIRILLGEEIDNPIISWKGNDINFKELGFKTTRRFSFSSEELYEKKLLYKNENCPVCNQSGEVR
jgi:hypothetical protein